MLKKTIRSLFLVCLVAPLTSLAGATYNGFHCWKNPGGDGGCYGSFLTARSSSDTTAQMLFVDRSDSDRYFVAQKSGVWYTCDVNASQYPAVNALWPAAVNARGYIYINWNTAGVCTYLEVFNGSAYGNY